MVMASIGKKPERFRFMARACPKPLPYLDLVWLIILSVGFT